MPLMIETVAIPELSLPVPNVLILLLHRRNIMSRVLHCLQNIPYLSFLMRIDAIYCKEATVSLESSSSHIIWQHEYIIFLTRQRKRVIFRRAETLCSSDNNEIQATIMVIDRCVI